MGLVSPAGAAEEEWKSAQPWDTFAFAYDQSGTTYTVTGDVGEYGYANANANDYNTSRILMPQSVKSGKGEWELYRDEGTRIWLEDSLAVRVDGEKYYTSANGIRRTGSIVRRSTGDALELDEQVHVAADGAIRHDITLTAGDKPYSGQGVYVTLEQPLGGESPVMTADGAGGVTSTWDDHYLSNTPIAGVKDVWVETGHSDQSRKTARGAAAGTALSEGKTLPVVEFEGPALDLQPGESYTMSFSETAHPTRRHVTFLANGGAFDDGTTKRLADADDAGHVAASSRPRPRKQGNGFAGWSRTSDGSSGIVDLSAEAFTQDTLLYAQWKTTIDEFALIFDPNGGDFDAYEEDLAPDDTFGLSDPGADAPKNMKFREWNTKPDGSGTSYGLDDYFDAHDYSADGYDSVTLYAQWEPASCAPLTGGAAAPALTAGGGLAGLAAFGVGLAARRRAGKGGAR